LEVPQNNAQSWVLRPPIVQDGTHLKFETNLKSTKQGSNTSKKSEICTCSHHMPCMYICLVKIPHQSYIGVLGEESFTNNIWCHVWLFRFLPIRACFMQYPFQTWQKSFTYFETIYVGVRLASFFPYVSLIGYYENHGKLLDHGPIFADMCNFAK
jgi:hypothetical protein